MDGCKAQSLKPKLDSPQIKRNASPVRKPAGKPVGKPVGLKEAHSTPRTPQRYPSPNVNRNPTTAGSSLLPNRPKSAERRPSSSSSRSTTPLRDTSVQISGGARRSQSEGVVWPTRRRDLSSSFQLESVPVVSKVSGSDKPERKRTPLGQSDNVHVITDNPISKMMEKQRWPGMAGGKTASINLSRSVDLTDKLARPGPVLSSLRSRGVSPKRCSPVSSDVSNSNSVTRSTENGAVSKLLSQLSPNATSRSVDLSDRPKISSIARGSSSPRRTLSGSSSSTVDNKEKEKRPQSRGSSPTARTVSGSSSIGSIARSKSVDATNKIKVHSRGSSPLRMIPASEEIPESVSTKRPESRGSSSRRTSSSEIQIPTGALSASSTSTDLGTRRTTRSIRAASPVRLSSVSDMSRSLDLDRIKRPASSSGQRKSVSRQNSESDDKMGLGPNTPPQRSERSKSLTRGSRTLSSPVPGFGRPSSSSSSSLSSPSTKRLNPSPSRGRPSTPSSTSSSSSGGSTRGTISCASFVNSVSQTRKVKNRAGGNQVEELHQLRVLHSRLLQWLFVNACVEDMHLNQKINSEGMLYSMWSDLSELRDSVVMKRLDVQQLTQETKLLALLNEQIEYLDGWEEVETEHCASLAGAIEAIRATTIRLPVTGGARANVLAVRNAVSSAVDIMQAMGSSVCFLLSKVENRNSLVEELAIVSAKEKAMLEEGRELLATVAKLHVQESSLKTQLIQRRQNGLEMEQVGNVVI